MLIVHNPVKLINGANRKLLGDFVVGRKLVTKLFALFLFAGFQIVFFELLM